MQSVLRTEEQTKAFRLALDVLDNHLSNMKFEDRPGKQQIMEIKSLVDSQYADIEEIRSSVDRFKTQSEIIENVLSMRKWLEEQESLKNE